MKKGKPSKYRRIWSGISISTTGIGIDSTLVTSDAAHLGKLITFIDDKRVFYDPVSLEVPTQLIEPVKLTRKLATATASSVDSVEASEIATRIADACRQFMRDFDQKDPTSVWAPVLSALRSEVEFSISLAVYDFNVTPPVNIQIQPPPNGGYSQ
ncbi:MAG: hypothetical protein Q4F10_11415 [Corynebacterium glutamicum]|nr:hypothetical protein [Corynebacterium glutamicum]